MIKPYYDHKGIKIYHGDCLEIMPELKPVDLVLTDPPYNCKKDYDVYRDNLTEEDYLKFMTQVVKMSQDKAKNQFWVVPRYKLNLFLPLFPNGHLVVIERKAQGPFRGGWSDQFEIAIAKGKPNKGAPSDLWKDIRLKGEGYFFREETFGNPGYTPYKIMKRAIYYLAENMIIDPFMGTGTSLRAAKDLGRKAIGIELSEKDCETAAKRLEQEVLFGLKE